MNKIKLSKLTGITHDRIDRNNVFLDFLELAAIRISNRVDPAHYKKRDERAKKINDLYIEKEHEEMYKNFEELFSQIQANINAGICEDIFGQLFEESESTRNGQDQSPYDVAKLLAHSISNNIKIPEKGYIDLDEPACGSGSLILAFAEAMTVKNMNYSEQLVVRAADKDPKCVHMAYIQLSLYGIPAVVIRGDTLLLKEYERWYTPMYIYGNWVWKSPFSLDGVKSSDDELLKRMIDPTYDALRRTQDLWGNI